MNDLASDDTETKRAQRNARAASRLFRLPFRGRAWRGAAGQWSGCGTGISIDFHDHRPYVAGDDPRHIDWRAYARSGSYVMKLYQEEVSPSVDIVVDTSASMRFETDKRRRSLETFYFCLDSALESGATPRVWRVGGGAPSRIDIESALLGGVDLFAGRQSSNDAGSFHPDALANIAFRSGSLRVLVSDCLFPEEPEPLVKKLVAGKGRGVVLAPSAKAERDPEWSGELDMTDCETGRRRAESLSATRLAAYREAYRRHFQHWSTSCRRRGVAFSEVPAEVELGKALREHALPNAAVEPCH